MKLASLVSGGKDSLYALYLAKKQGHKIETLISFESENTESYMFHIPNIRLVKTISGLVEIPLIRVPTKGIKEKELDDIRSVLEKAKSFGVQGVTTGAIASNYQKSRIDKICSELGLESIAPFWGRSQEEVLREMISAGFVPVIASVGAPPLDKSWLGRTIDSACISELSEMHEKHGINVMGEGGEYCTLVVDCPLYKSHRIVIQESEKLWDESSKSGVMKINKISLEEK